jgi:centrosomal protein CEP76
MGFDLTAKDPPAPPIGLTCHQGRGDVEDHTLLLTSLLLGFGLDAFMCLGTKLATGADGRATLTAHTWAASFGADGSIIFWESLTAERSVGSLA